MCSRLMPSQSCLDLHLRLQLVPSLLGGDSSLNRSGGAEGLLVERGVFRG